MARILGVTGERRRSLTAGWEIAVAEAGAGPAPDDPALRWLPAAVPGAAAGALIDAGLDTPESLASLQSRHIYYRLQLDEAGPRLLRFGGLATLCDIYLDGVKIAATNNMFLPCDVAIESRPGARLLLHFRPLNEESLPRGRRQRWRPHLIATPHMRNARATLLGHMPGWCPDVAPVGPYRRVTLVEQGPVRARDADVRVRYDARSGVGSVAVFIAIDGIDAPLRLVCAGASTPLARGADGAFAAELTLPGIAPWMPHTHGTPHLHGLAILGEGVRIELGRIGFRELTLDTGPDGAGFALVINGQRIFCRGANWTNADVARLPGEADAYRPLLTRARDAGMNMLRVPGVVTRETPAFFDLLDEMGLLAFVDQPLANFDYDVAMLTAEAGLEAEITASIADIQTSPSLAVVCGGSEIAQQAAMLSLPESVWRQPFFEETFPRLVAAQRPDVVALPNSPWGGALPFAANAGVSHYYGVGAYMRPLEDARRANVRFASECLAFAQLPQPEHIDPALSPASPEWKAQVVRDLKADWDFEDVRDHYVGLLYGVDVAALRRDDPARYVALSCAAPGEVMAATFAEWRRAGSTTAGGLVWTLSDLGPGFGWGVIDHVGRPKPAYHALKRAFAPLTLALTDEGVNGLDLHVINDGPAARRLTVTLTAIGADGAPVIDGARTLDIAGHGAEKLNATTLFGMFFDVTGAYRFGPPAHEVTVARLTDAETGAFLAEAFHFPYGRGNARRDCGLRAALEPDGDGWALRLTTLLAAQSVHITAEGFEPEDDWFHLAPGAGRRVRLAGDGRPAGIVTALNHRTPALFA